MHEQPSQGVFPFTPSLPTSARGPGPALKTTPLPSPSQRTTWQFSASTSAQSPGPRIRWLQAGRPRSSYAFHQIFHLVLQDTVNLGDQGTVDVQILWVLVREAAPGEAQPLL